jgi:hypothetical protein
MDQEPEKPQEGGEIIWNLEQASVVLDNIVRSPHSLQIDDNNRIYIGTIDGIYIFNLKKIANKKNFTEYFIDVNDLYFPLSFCNKFRIKKSFSEEATNALFEKFGIKTRINILN